MEFACYAREEIKPEELMATAEAQQKEVCRTYNAEYTPVDDDAILGISKKFDKRKLPINGLRHPRQGGTNGWYIWTGELNDAEDFFEPQHVKHITNISPEVVQYLALPPGWRFLIGEKEYIDVWYDESLLRT